MLIICSQHCSIKYRNYHDFEHSYVAKNHDTDNTNKHVNNKDIGVMGNACLQDENNLNEGRSDV